MLVPILTLPLEPLGLESLERDWGLINLDQIPLTVQGLGATLSLLAGSEQPIIVFGSTWLLRDDFLPPPTLAILLPANPSTYPARLAAAEAAGMQDKAMTHRFEAAQRLLRDDSPLPVMYIIQSHGLAAHARFLRDDPRGLTTPPLSTTHVLRR